MGIVEIEDLRIPLKDLSVEDLQAAGRSIKKELEKRFINRRETCEHSESFKGYVVLEDKPNITEGCTYCLETGV